ncbi:MAG: YchJ family protein [Myxococcales bacterium]|nr:YchJ family protein [Myxococcales bacterium]
MDPCPCGSGHVLAACCGPWLTNMGAPPTAEALMRSRYTAFTRGDGAYLARTQLAPVDADDLGAWGRSVRWLGLSVYRTEAGGPEDAEGQVWFLARFEEGGRPRNIHEVSRFERRDGRWIYAVGATPRLGRNDPCPCGSGKKFKRCCGGAG